MNQLVLVATIVRNAKLGVLGYKYGTEIGTVQCLGEGLCTCKDAKKAMSNRTNVRNVKRPTSSMLI